jgi:hypothetical protein
MEFDSALNLQAEIFKEAFRYEEARTAFSEDAAGPDIPVFMPPAGGLGEMATGPAGTMAYVSDDLPGRRAVSRAWRETLVQARQIALGIGVKGGTAGDHEIAVMYQQRHLKNARIMDRIHAAARGECRFSFIGIPKAYTADPWHRSHVLDPLRIGGSIAHSKVSAGTLGCFVRHSGSGKVGVLSNNHVLANVNAGTVGDAIWQPSKKDGGSAESKVASLEAFVAMEPGDGPNFHDCAWASLDPDARQGNRRDLFDSAGVHIGALSTGQPSEAWPGAGVVKVGRTTGYTQGVVDAVNVNNLTIRYKGNRLMRFDGQVQIESMSKTPFARPGDSGSLILNTGFEPVGLLFSGSASGGFENVGFTWAHPLEAVLAALDLAILT